MADRQIKSIDLSKTKCPESISTESHSLKERGSFERRKKIHKIIRPTKSIELISAQFRDSSESDKVE